MRTVSEIRSMFEKLDGLLCIDTSNVEIVFSKRAVKRHGSCKFCRGANGTWIPEKIMIADFLRQGDEMLLRDTVLHEYAHAAAAILTGENCGHNRVWKAVCKKIGCSGRVYAENTAASRQRVQDAAKYAVTCVECGTESLYMRKGDVVKRLEKGRNPGVICTVCKGRKFKLTVLR